MVDCTPDLSHAEQISIVIRGVDASKSTGAEVYKHFMEFVGVCEATEKGLFDQIFVLLAKFGILVSDCRVVVKITTVGRIRVAQQKA